MFLALEKKYYDIREIAEFTGISEKTLYRWARQNIMPSIKIGKLIRFDLGAVQEWLKKFNREGLNGELLM